MKLLMSGASAARSSARISGPPAPDSSLQQSDYGDEQANHRDDRSAPEKEHPLDELRTLRCEPGLELGFEPFPVAVVQFPQVVLVISVHCVEPVHELAGNVVAQLVIELSGQLCCDRHVSS